MSTASRVLDVLSKKVWMLNGCVTERQVKFIDAWKDTYGLGRSTTLGELYQLCADADLMGSVLGSKNERSQRTNLGLALIRKNQSWVGNIMIERMNDNAHTKTAQYRLIEDIEF